RRFAVAGQIVTDERQLARQRCDEIPEVPIDAEAVQQHEATAGAAPMQCNRGVEYHGQLSPDALSCCSKGYCLGIFAAFTSSRLAATSFLKKEPNSASVIGIGSTLTAARRSRTAGNANAFITSSCSFSAMACGVPAGR